MITHKGYRGCKPIVISWFKTSAAVFFFLFVCLFFHFTAGSYYVQPLIALESSIKSQKHADSHSSCCWSDSVWRTDTLQTADASTNYEDFVYSNVSPQAVPLFTILVKWKCCVMYWWRSASNTKRSVYNRLSVPRQRWNKADSPVQTCAFKICLTEVGKNKHIIQVDTTA